MPQTDVATVARVYIARHGSNAEVEAHHAAARLERFGDRWGASFWTRVGQEIAWWAGDAGALAILLPLLADS